VHVLLQLEGGGDHHRLRAFSQHPKSRGVCGGSRCWRIDFQETVFTVLFSRFRRQLWLWLWLLLRLQHNFQFHHPGLGLLQVLLLEPEQVRCPVAAPRVQVFKELKAPLDVVRQRRQRLDEGLEVGFVAAGAAHHRCRRRLADEAVDAKLSMETKNVLADA
jgi:hypothetical protein